MIATYEQFDRLLSFASVHHALRAAKLLEQAGIAMAEVPTPREIDISCGQCLLFAAADQAAALTLLNESKVHWSKLFVRNAVTKEYILMADWEGYNE